MNKPTIATLKSFLRHNSQNLYIKVRSNFDGMVDCVMPVEDDYRKVDSLDWNDKHTLGIKGAWLVGQSRDYITSIPNGFEIYNSCGTWEIIKK